MIAAGALVASRSHLPLRVDCGRLLAGDPGIVLILRDDVNGDRHEGVIASAKFGALAVEPAFMLRSEPSLLQTARHRVLLDPEGRNEEGMDHVLTAQRHLHRLAQRHMQRVDLALPAGMARTFATFADAWRYWTGITGYACGLQRDTAAGGYQVAAPVFRIDTRKGAA